MNRAATESTVFNLGVVKDWSKQEDKGMVKWAEELMLGVEDMCWVQGHNGHGYLTFMTLQL